MRLLLDTHVVLWQLDGSRTLSRPARDAISTATELFFSAVSFAEIGMKAAVGMLSVPPDFPEAVRRSGLTVLPLETQHGLDVATLPMHHRDPFDRLLVSQARSEQLTIVSADRRLAAYDVRFVDAG